MKRRQSLTARLAHQLGRVVFALETIEATGHVDMQEALGLDIVVVAPMLRPSLDKILADSRAVLAEHQKRARS